MSQIERVYAHLQIRGSITNAEAHNLYGIRHLPSVIRDIKKRHNVNITMSGKPDRIVIAKNAGGKYIILKKRRKQMSNIEKLVEQKSAFVCRQFGDLKFYIKEKFKKCDEIKIFLAFLLLLNFAILILLIFGG